MNPFRNGTQRADAFNILARHGSLESAEWAKELGIKSKELSKVVRPGIDAGIYKRERVEDRETGYRYSIADEAIPLDIPKYRGRYPSVWGYAQGVEA